MRTSPRPSSWPRWPASTSPRPGHAPRVARRERPETRTMTIGEKGRRANRHWSPCSSPSPTRTTRRSTSRPTGPTYRVRMPGDLEVVSTISGPWPSRWPQQPGRRRRQRGRERPMSPRPPWRLGSAGRTRPRRPGRRSTAGTWPGCRPAGPGPAGGPTGPRPAAAGGAPSDRGLVLPQKDREVRAFHARRRAPAGHGAATPGGSPAVRVGRQAGRGAAGRARPRQQGLPGKGPGLPRLTARLRVADDQRAAAPDAG